MKHPKSTSESLTRVARNGFGATLLITSFHSIISRNILLTDVLPLLEASGQTRIVILYPQQKKAFFEAEFTDARVALVPVDTKASRRDILLSHLSLAALGTKTLYNKRRTELKGRGVILSAFLAHSWSRPCIRMVNALFAPRDPFIPLLDTYAPDLVFSTDVQNEFDVRLSFAARDRHIPVVAMVRSWDNLTAKGLIRFVPDTLVVNNDVIKEEAITLHGIAPETIKVVGIPHYDRYLRDARTPREAFFSRIGGDPGKKMLLFVPTGDRYLADNTVDRDVLRIVAEHLPDDFQILVRLPPSDRVRAFESMTSNARIIFDRPSTFFSSVKETELGRSDDIHLADTLEYSDIVVSGPSTMCIDAAVFDKPIILFGFDGYTPRPYFTSIRRFFDYSHFAPVLESCGVTLASSADGLRTALAAYIANPHKDEEGRRTLVSQECFKIDGHSCERLAQVLLAMLSP